MTTSSNGMRLLICTQAVDRSDPVLGFFHRWIEELAKKYEQVTVLCLREGEHKLPANVRVIPLRRGAARAPSFPVLLRLLQHAWNVRGEYDTVFVHMSQEFVLGAGLLWRMLGKPVYLWRNHHAGSLLTDLAAGFCCKVFCTSQYSYTARYAKTLRMPVGIDTEYFRPDLSIERMPRAILSIGRIAPSKHIEVLVEALRILNERSVDFTASIYGTPTAEHAGYYTSLVEQVAAYKLQDRVSFLGAVDNREVPELANRHAVMVNMSASGMYDKTMFEALACGTPVIASNQDLKGEIDEQYLFTQGDAVMLADRLATVLAADSIDREKLRAYVSSRHSLGSLVERLSAIMASSC